MGVPTSQVGYTSAMPRREDHEVHKDMWVHWTKKKIHICLLVPILNQFNPVRLHYNAVNFISLLSYHVRPTRRWVDNIRMDLQKVGCGYMDWIGLVQDRDRWRTLVSAVMNLRVP